MDASGYYSASLVPFSYQVRASAPNYPLGSGPYPVTVASGVVTQRDFALDRPDIAVAPTSLSAAVVAVGTATQAVTIANLGTYALEFDIRELETGPSMAAMPGRAHPRVSSNRRPPQTPTHSSSSSSRLRLKEGWTSSSPSRILPISAKLEAAGEPVPAPGEAQLGVQQLSAVRRRRRCRT